MSTVVKKIYLPVLFEFMLIIGIVEIIFSFLLQKIGLQFFQMVPYLRLIILFSTFLYFFKKKLFSLKIFKISLQNTNENKLILVWVFLSFFGLLVGVFNTNPILYFVTDFFYIIFGFLLFRIFCTNDILLLQINHELTNSQQINFVFTIVFFTIICFFLDVIAPSFLIIYCLIMALHFFNNKKYSLFFYSLLPFLIQIITSGRALLIVFLFMFFFWFLQKNAQKININQMILKLIILTPVLIIFLTFFFADFLKIIINVMPEASALKHRLAQIYDIFNGTAKWNTPQMLSLKQRYDEAIQVIDFWTENPLRFLFGGGMGATMEGYAFKDGGVTDTALLGKSAIHNIHILPFSLIFRYGLFGLLIFFMLIKNLISYLYKIIYFKNNLFKTTIIFQFSWIVYSLPAASYLWTCPVFWITLAYASNERKFNIT